MQELTPIPNWTHILEVRSSVYALKFETDKIIGRDNSFLQYNF